MKEHLLINILTGEATGEEREEFYCSIENNKAEEELFYEVESLWLRTSLTQEKVPGEAEFDSIWNKIQQRKKGKSRSIGLALLRYAGMFVILLGLGGLIGYYFADSILKNTDSGTMKYSALRGSVSIVELPDGTKVWLNSESELTFHEDYKNKQRLAELRGEAYFEVPHREDCPLLVKVGDIVVRDLGTIFNIKAYPGDKYIETALVEGDVDILKTGGKPIVSLEPGESAVYYKEENRMELRAINESVLSAWRDGKFVIRDQRLEDIFTELSRWYGIEFKFENDRLKDYRFTGNVKKTTTVLHVLRVLKATTDFRFRIIENIDKPDVIIIY